MLKCAIKAIKIVIIIMIKDLVYSNKDVEIFLLLREYILKLQFSPSLSL